MPRAPSFFQFLPLLFRQTFSRQQMPRTPEPEAVTDAAENVLQYDQVMTTKLAIAYALGLEVIYRARPVEWGGSAVDLACGPGHFSICLAKYLKLDEMDRITKPDGLVMVMHLRISSRTASDVQARPA